MLKQYILVCLLLICSYYSKAQQQAHEYLGTKSIYHPLQAKHTPPPQGFKPVFINYVGRHGARFMTKPGSDVLIIEVMKKADSQKALTSLGKQVLNAALQFESVEKDNYGNITVLGAGEQKSIAERLYKEYKLSFRQQGIDVLMTTKVRTQQSASAFLQGIPAAANESIHSGIMADATDTLLRFYDLSPAYDVYKNSASLLQHTDSLRNDKQTVEVVNNVCGRLFTLPFLQSLAGGKIDAGDGSGKPIRLSAEHFTEALYDVYSIHFSASKEMQPTEARQQADDFDKAFTKTDLRWLSLLNEADDFYAKGPSEDTLGIQITIAAPLLQNLISTTDSIINGSKTSDAIFRFTHAEAISPLATLLGIPQASHTSESVFRFQNHWMASEIIPLSANIQWIVYANGKQFLVKVLLNESEVALPIATASLPYYEWQTFKSYYLQKLSLLQRSK